MRVLTQNGRHILLDERLPVLSVDSELQYVRVVGIQVTEGFEPLYLCFAITNKCQRQIRMQDMHRQVGRSEKRPRTGQLGTCHGRFDEAMILKKAWGQVSPGEVKRRTQKQKRGLVLMGGGRGGGLGGEGGGEGDGCTEIR